MRQPYSPIRVGSVTLPFLWAKKAWLLPDNTLTTNPIKAQLAAERQNKKLKLLAAALSLTAA
ncbi:MAG: DUF1317 family protein [Pantoea sp.]|uniref:DUF1317 family protein n=1 Tax=Pantoea piersonii TaxID=2364647 RepID=A0AAJ5QHP8_9GAMM|nr:DUF1317 family protein [Pantoea piersonii]MDU6435209.1 DUF1317 family protein [Pantoea sp.]WBG90062.1 DUF1317 family protein [Pantoea piersonii]